MNFIGNQFEAGICTGFYWNCISVGFYLELYMDLSLNRIWNRCSLELNFNRKEVKVDTVDQFEIRRWNSKISIGNWDRDFNFCWDWISIGFHLGVCRNLNLFNDKLVEIDKALIGIECQYDFRSNLVLDRNWKRRLIGISVDIGVFLLSNSKKDFKSEICSIIVHL